MIHNTASFIRRHALAAPERGPVIVGLSGGADSVALLAVMRALGYRCVAAHCNYGLRGAESERDRRCALAAAQRLGAEWAETRFATRQFCRERRVGLEEGCRMLRYEWFAELAARFGAQAVAVAHHREDQAETFFLNLLRGAGLAGLKGMLPRNGLVIRPLLEVSRSEILDFLRTEGLDYVVDSSNLSDDYTRNRIRHHVIPALQQAAPAGADALRSVTMAMGHLDECRRLLSALVRERAAAFMGPEGLDVARMVGGGVPEPAAFLYELLAPQGVSRRVSDAIAAAALLPGCRVFTAPGGSRWLLDRGRLRAYEAGDDDAAVTASRLSGLPLEVEEIAAEEFKPRKGVREVMYLDAEADATEALWELRPWRRGDRLEPFGMKGSRLVSDILNDAKVGLDRKQRVRVLTRNGVVLWVVGFRASRLFAVTEATQRVLCLHAGHYGYDGHGGQEHSDGNVGC